MQRNKFFLLTSERIEEMKVHRVRKNKIRFFLNFPQQNAIERRENQGDAES